MINFLVSNKADLFAKDKMGNTAFAYANNDKIKKLLSNPVYEILLKLARGEFPK